MIKSTIPDRLCRGVLMCLFGLASAADVAAHGDQDWNEFTIDNKTDQVEASIQKVKKVIGDIVLERREVSKWPDPELLRTRDELVLLQEELNEMLNHFTEDGIHLQLTSSLRENPRAGRAVAGSYAIETGIKLLEHMAASASPDDFEEEMHAGGAAAMLFDLMDAYADSMGLYRALRDKSD